MTRFDYFILLAEMRTGSNFLEATLNDLDGVSCVGELFNPAFIGHPKSDKVFGVSLLERDADPHGMVAKVKQQDGLCVFRYFREIPLIVLLAGKLHKRRVNGSLRMRPTRNPRPSPLMPPLLKHIWKNYSPSKCASCMRYRSRDKAHSLSAMLICVTLMF